MVEGLGGDVLPQPLPHAGDADAPRFGPFVAALKVFGGRAPRAISPPQHLQAFAEGDSSPSFWPVAVGVFAVERIEDAQFQRIHPEREREFVEQLLLRHGALRHAETTKGARRAQCVWMAQVVAR